MHKLLQRQLRQARQGGAKEKLDLDLLVQLIDAAYAEVDRERRITAHAHQVLRDEYAELAQRELRANEAMDRIGAEKVEAERARAAVEAELLKQERVLLLGRLTASVAHELRNPLSTIRNTLHAIHEAAAHGGVDIGRQMSRVERTIDRCDGIIADLLDYAGTGQLNTAPLRLDEWLGKMLDKMKLPTGITLERRLAAPAAVVPFDPERLHCAFANVIENAVEAITDMPNLVERRITVATHVAESAEITIIDTGPGIPAKVLERIFEPLFSTRAFGTGLGLPTAKRIIEQHGGDVAVGSSEGAGTRVQIRLPLSAARSRAA